MLPPAALTLSAMKSSWACIEPPMRYKIRAAKAAKMKQVPVCFSPRRGYPPWWGLPFRLSLFFRTMTRSKMVDWRPWRPLTRENEVERCRSQLLRIKRKNENRTFCLTRVPTTSRNVPIGPISNLGTRKNLCEYLLAGFCHRIRLGCLILLIAGATTISQKYGATSIPSNLVVVVCYCTLRVYVEYCTKTT